MDFVAVPGVVPQGVDTALDIKLRVTNGFPIIQSFQFRELGDVPFKQISKLEYLCVFFKSGLNLARYSTLLMSRPLADASSFLHSEFREKAAFAASTALLTSS